MKTKMNTLNIRETYFPQNVLDTNLKIFPSPLKYSHCNQATWLLCTVLGKSMTLDRIEGGIFRFGFCHTRSCSIAGCIPPNYFGVWLFGLRIDLASVVLVIFNQLRLKKQLWWNNNPRNQGGNFKGDVGTRLMGHVWTHKKPWEIPAFYYINCSIK